MLTLRLPTGLRIYDSDDCRTIRVLFEAQKFPSVRRDLESPECLARHERLEFLQRFSEPSFASGMNGYCAGAVLDVKDHANIQDPLYFNFSTSPHFEKYSERFEI